MRLITAAAFVLALSFPAVACEETMESVATLLDRTGVPYDAYKGEDAVEFAAQVKFLSGIDPTDVTGAIIVEFTVGRMFGLETADGCFSPDPIPLSGIGA